MENILFSIFRKGEEITAINPFGKISEEVKLEQEITPSDILLGQENKLSHCSTGTVLKIMDPNEVDKFLLIWFEELGYSICVNWKDILIQKIAHVVV